MKDPDEAAVFTTARKYCPVVDKIISMVQSAPRSRRWGEDDAMLLALSAVPSRKRCGRAGHWSKAFRRNATHRREWGFRQPNRTPRVHLNRVIVTSKRRTRSSARFH